jgi:osmotically-inducible protein OsmY
VSVNIQAIIRPGRIEEDWRMHKRWRCIVAAFAVVVTLSGCQELKKIPVGRYMDDYSIASAVKTQIAADAAMQGSRIEVVSDDRVVYLKGDVTNAAQKLRAEQIAFNVNGVRGVANQLQIQPVP